MRTRKMLSVMIAVLGMVAFFAATSHAANEWYTCTVVNVGPSFGGYYVYLDDDGTAFEGADKKWFKLRPGQEKEMLATALTAMSNAESVWVNTNLVTPAEPTVNALYLGQAPPGY
ncbi:MAG: hypothetical protein SWE60_23125 [Thermodesulfobacteriota bacterium]|nr:hypothetical protein [Thermodesulfobacteriota bacterium]